MGEAKNVFKELSSIDVKGKVKQKKDLAYLPWSSAWAEVKKLYPEASWHIYPQIMDDAGNTRFWHQDDKSGWVEVGVTINGEEIVEVLPIMDYRNQPVPAEKITSFDANKSLKRCLVKAIAMHGLGLYIYEGEDLPEDVSRANELRTEIMGIIKKKCSLSDKAQETVAAMCKKAEKEANPDLDESMITGTPKNIDDVEVLEKLRKQLLTVRK